MKWNEIKETKRNEMKPILLLYLTESRTQWGFTIFMFITNGEGNKLWKGKDVETGEKN